MNILNKILFLLTFIFSIALSVINAQTRTAILYSESALRDFNRGSNDYLNEYTAWEIFLMQNKINFDVIYDEDLEPGLEDEFDILIIPRYYIQSSQVNTLFKTFLMNGKSLLFSNTSISPSLNYSGNGFKDLFGITLTDYGVVNKINFTQTAFETPLNLYKKNSDFLISAKQETQFIDIKLSSCSAAGNILEANQNYEISSIVYGKRNSGKFVFMGFGLTDLIGGVKEKLEFELFLIDALKWLDIEVDAYPVVTTNEKEKSRLLFVEYNNALTENFVTALKQNGFIPHIVINNKFNLDNVLFNKSLFDQIVVDIHDLENKNKSIEEIINHIRKIETSLKSPVESVLLNSELKQNLLDRLKEYGIKNFITIHNRATKAEVDKAGNLFLFINLQEQVSLIKPLEAFYCIPQIDCEKDFETEYLIYLKTHSDDQIAFTDLASLRSKLEIEKNLVLRIEHNEEIELVVRNNNPLEVKDVTIYVNMNNFIALNGRSFKPLNYSVDPINGMIKIFLKKLFPRSEERFTLLEGN